MIEIRKLSPQDVGRKVTYHREFCKREFGVLSSWNAKYVFVRFKGPTGEACEPQDVTFYFQPSPVPGVDLEAFERVKKLTNNFRSGTL